MNTVTPNGPNAEAEGAFGARRAVPRVATTRRGPGAFVPFALLTLASLLAGALIGALIMRQRHRAQDIVVSVNGATITQSAFFGRLQSAAGNNIMRLMINEELMRQYARRQGIYPTDAEVNARYAAASKQPGFAQAAQTQSPDAIKDGIRLNLIEARLLSKDVTVTPGEVRAFYTANVDRRNPNARFFRPETATIAVIISKTEADSQAALHELTGGLPFDRVARARSVDTSRQNGGVLPPLRRGQTQGKAPELEQAIFNMKIGAQTGPQKFANAWWIIRCLDRSAEETLPFEKVEEECRMGALLLKGIPKNSRPSSQDFAAFKNKAAVQAFWPNYAGVAQSR